MKTIAAILLTGAAMVAASPVLAGRDESQMMMVQQAIAKKKAENLARVQQGQAGLAGPIGTTGSVGPGSQPVKARRDPTTHP